MPNMAKSCVEEISHIHYMRGNNLVCIISSPCDDVYMCCRILDVSCVARSNIKTGVQKGCNDIYVFPCCIPACVVCVRA